MKAHRLTTKRAIVIHTPISHLIAGVGFLDINIAQDCDKSEERPFPGIPPADADALSVAEALLNAAGEPIVLLANHALGAEGVWLFEDVRVTVDLREDGDDGLVRRKLVGAITEDNGAFVFGVGFDVEARGDGGETEGFADDGLAVREFGEVGVFPLLIAADDRVDFLAGLGDLLRVLDEVVQCEADEVRGRGAADEDVDDFIEDLAFAERAARLRVLAVHDGMEHVLLVRRVLAPGGHDLGTVIAHCLNGVVVFAVVEEPAEDAGAGWPLHGFPGGSFLRGDDGRFLAKYTIDALVKEAEHIGSVVETVHVISHADLLVVA